MIQLYGFSIEVNPFAPFLFNNPFLHFLITIIPIVIFFLVNYWFKENYYFLFLLFLILLVFTIYFSFIAQNNLAVGRTLAEYYG